MGKLTIKIAMFNSYVSMFTRPGIFHGVLGRLVAVDSFYS